MASIAPMLLAFIYRKIVLRGFKFGSVFARAINWFAGKKAYVGVRAVASASPTKGRTARNLSARTVV